MEKHPDVFSIHQCKLYHLKADINSKDDVIIDLDEPFIMCGSIRAAGNITSNQALYIDDTGFSGDISAKGRVNLAGHFLECKDVQAEHIKAEKIFGCRVTADSIEAPVVVAKYLTCKTVQGDIFNIQHGFTVNAGDVSCDCLQAGDIFVPKGNLTAKRHIYTMDMLCPEGNVTAKELSFSCGKVGAIKVDSLEVRGVLNCSNIQAGKLTVLEKTKIFCNTIRIEKPLKGVARKKGQSDWSISACEIEIPNGNHFKLQECVKAGHIVIQPKNLGHHGNGYNGTEGGRGPRAG